MINLNQAESEPSPFHTLGTRQGGIKYCYAFYYSDTDIYFYQRKQWDHYLRDQDKSLASSKWIPNFPWQWVFSIKMFWFIVDVVLKCLMSQNQGMFLESNGSFVSFTQLFQNTNLYVGDVLSCHPQSLSVGELSGRQGIKYKNAIIAFLFFSLAWPMVKGEEPLIKICSVWCLSRGTTLEWNRGFCRLLCCFQWYKFLFAKSHHKNY